MCMNMESPFCSSFVSVVGFDAACSEGPRAPCRRVRRQRSALSERMSSVRGSPCLSPAPSQEFARDDASVSTEAWSEDLGLEGDDGSFSSCDFHESGSQLTQPLAIRYTRAAKERIDRAEQQGRARQEQLEMLQAVRAYMASKAAARTPKAVPSC